jgi:SH3 domain-containing kinase-binding protein 1
VITVLWRETKDGWWRGEINGKQGKFPSNYCEFISEEEPTAPQMPDEIRSSTVSPSVASSSSPPKPPGEPLVRVRATFSFSKRKEGELSFGKGDVIVVLKQHKSGWWKGEFNGQVGLFPSNYCTIIQ